MFIEVILPLLLVSVFTFGRCRVDIQQATKAQKQACYNGEFFLYVLIAIAGNSVATYLASTVLCQRIPPGLVALCSAFVGVFAFQGVMSNTNITMFGKKTLTFEEWMNKARDNAIARATAQEVQIVNKDRLSITQELRKLHETELNTYIAHYLGPTVVAQLNDKATSIDADPILYKALALATSKPEEVKAILQTARDAPPQPPNEST